MDYNGPTFLTQLKGRVSQILDSHCQINTDSDNDPAPDTLSYAADVWTPSLAGTWAVPTNIPVNPNFKDPANRQRFS